MTVRPRGWTPKSDESWGTIVPRSQKPREMLVLRDNIDHLFDFPIVESEEINSRADGSEAIVRELT